MSGAATPALVDTSLGRDTCDHGREPGHPAPSTVDPAELRAVLLRALEEQGFEIGPDGNLVAPDLADKNRLRALHRAAVEASRRRAEPSLRKHEGRLLSRFASGADVDIEGLSPEVRLVTPGSEEELLFRYARLHWSVPVSAGYGRRLRFVVIDRHNGCLIGVIGLGDPVIQLRARDGWIGWDQPALHQRLRHVMDAFVLGAVPPYNALLCGKLVAMLAASREVRSAFKQRYEGSTSLISGRAFDGNLALITTQSALGRSSVYSRLALPEGPRYIRVGETRGSGEFHFSNGVYSQILDFARECAPPSAKNQAWGNGFRNRREVVRKALKLLDLSPDLVYHGIRREVYCLPLAIDTREFLRGETDSLRYWDYSADEIAAWFRQRWLLPRAARTSDWREFDPESLRLWPERGRVRD